MRAPGLALCAKAKSLGTLSKVVIVIGQQVACGPPQIIQESGSLDARSSTIRPATIGR